MRLLPNINYGIARFPERTARRLRVLNVAAWCTAVFALGFAVYDLFHPALWKVAVANVIVAALLLTIPLWHRFGPVAAPLAYVVVSYSSIFIICAMLGTDSGMQMQYLAITAGVALILGTERIALSIAVAVVAVILVVALELLVPHDTGLLSAGAMLGNFVACVIGTAFILFAIVFYAVWQADRAEAVAEREFQRSEALLRNILPATVADRLKSESGRAIADRYDEASLLFADMAGFTARAGETTPVDLVHFLNRVFTDFDRLVENHGLEKIKTTGDCYVVLSGAPVPRADHAAALARLALDMRDAAAGLQDPHGRDVPIRIGIASGPVVAGIVGARKFFYDVWGDAVNVASRMESTGVPGMIQISQDAYMRLKDEFVTQARGTIDVKGKGQMSTWFLLARR
jgi:adenylate cyclase